MTKETTLDRRTEELIDDMMQGNARALAKLITIVEQDDEVLVRQIEHLLGKRIERRRLENFDYNAPAPQPQRSGSRGSRPQRSRRS